MPTPELAVKERPLLYSAPMVLAILGGSKSQTRRVVKDYPSWTDRWYRDSGGSGLWMPDGPSPTGKGGAAGHWRPCPHGKPGDRLWVREMWAKRADGMVAWKAGPYPYDAKHDLVPWKPSIHMPRWACRIVLEITEVRVERVQAITPADALAEGIAEYAAAKGYGDSGRVHPVEAFAELWDEINAKRGFPWAADPFVWAVTFRRLAASP